MELTSCYPFSKRIIHHFSVSPFFCHLTMNMICMLPPRPVECLFPFISKINVFLLEIRWFLHFGSMIHFIIANAIISIYPGWSSNIFSEALSWDVQQFAFRLYVRPFIIIALSVFQAFLIHGIFCFSFGRLSDSPSIKNILRRGIFSRPGFI